MSIKVFCDENITNAIFTQIKLLGFETSGVRLRGLIRIQNGDLLELISTENYIFITFDKDFLDDRFSHTNGIIVIDIKPNKDKFTIPIIKDFFNLIKGNKVDLKNKKIQLNQNFLNTLNF